MKCYVEDVPTHIQQQLSQSIEFVPINHHQVDCLVIYFQQWQKSSKERIKSLSEQAKLLPILVLLGDAGNEQHQLEALQAGAYDCSCTSSLDLILIKLEKLIKNANTQKALASKTEQVDEVLMRIAQEESFARHVYEEITGGAVQQQKDYFSMQQSADGFCGDFLFEMASPTGIRYVFLADAMGHGLAAALSIMPVIHVVKAMAHRSMPITTILQEVNRRLNSELPDDRFVTLAALEISPFSQTMTVVNAGLPDIFVLMQDGTLESCPSQCIPLGIADGAAFSFKPCSFKLDQLSRLFMFTDGLIEQENADGQVIGKQGLFECLVEYATQNVAWDEIATLFNSHKAGVALSDDVTLCAINFAKFAIANPSSDCVLDNRKGEINFNLTVSGDYLKSVDIPAFVSKFLYASDIEGKIAGKTFTAIAELYQNGLDHGVLQLDSELKNDIEGFAEYLEKREERIAELVPSDEVCLSVSYEATTGISATVTDSGVGYDTNTVNPEQYSLHGRGLALVRQLCEKFETNASGNKVSIVLKE